MVFLQRYRRRQCELFMGDQPKVSDFRFRWASDAGSDVFLDIVKNKQHISVKMKHAEAAALCLGNTITSSRPIEVEEVRQLIVDEQLSPLVSCAFHRSAFTSNKDDLSSSQPLAFLDEDILFVDERERKKEWCRMVEEAPERSAGRSATLGHSAAEAGRRAAKPKGTFGALVPDLRVFAFLLALVTLMACEIDLAKRFTLLAGVAFIAPQRPSRNPGVAVSFFGPEDRSQVKRTEEDAPKLGGIWDVIQGVDNYTKKGSGSIQGPLAGVPWLTVFYFVIFFWLINLFVSEGGKPVETLK
ncbi:unnamed protein product [Effrenium voratum]|nr:unnamed protein product [Effrenium voratum]